MCQTLTGAASFAAGAIRSSPTVEEYESTDGNTTIHYVAMWVNVNAEPGPMSESVSATVTC
jgi:hypothetical protein